VHLIDREVLPDGEGGFEVFAMVEAAGIEPASA